jgi:putative spermidine/putrescine transport system ATP-binding protein
MTAAIRFVDVTRHFGQVRAVDGVSFTIDDGEFFTLLGPSGSGKTTCLRLIGGFEQPSSGNIELFGVEASGVPPYERDVNTVFQDYALFPHMTVVENVEYGLMIKKVARPERRRRAEEALEMVRLPGLSDRKPAQLSGGQRQRVALARALINRPRALLLDEPLGALDLKLRHEMQVELKALQKKVGITFVLVTHDQDEALSMSDRIAVFNLGKVVQIGRPEEIYEHPKTAFVAGFVGVTNIVGRAAVRPEKIEISASLEAPVGSELVVHQGTITTVAYLGATTRFTVLLDGGGQELIVIETNRSRSPAAVLAMRGERVRVSWSRAHEQVLEA